MKIAIIPARKGSKRIKNKNIKLFFGKPIIYWSIKAAKDSKLFDKIIVSTDCKIIANIANKFGPAKKLTGTMTSLQGGLFKEIMDGAGALAGKGPTKGRATAFSVDDLGADWAGATRMPLDVALAKGLFKHTEPGVTGIGQGKPIQVLKNVLSDEKTNAKDKIK